MDFCLLLKIWANKLVKIWLEISVVNTEVEAKGSAEVCDDLICNNIGMYIYIYIYIYRQIDR